MMYNLDISSNIGNANFNVDEIHYKNIISEARSFFTDTDYSIGLKEGNVSVSCDFFTIDIDLSELKIDEILQQKGVSLDSLREKLLVESKINPTLMKFIKYSKSFDSINSILAKPILAALYMTQKKKILNKLDEVSNLLVKKALQQGINIEIKDIELY